jgi:hypothetical protein
VARTGAQVRSSYARVYTVFWQCLAVDETLPLYGHLGAKAGIPLTGPGVVGRVHEQERRTTVL